jgi:hypothetical protein
VASDRRPQSSPWLASWSASTVRALAGHQADVAHQARGRIESAEIPQLGYQRRGGDPHAPHCLQAVIQPGAGLGLRGQRFDLGRGLRQPLGLTLDLAHVVRKPLLLRLDREALAADPDQVLVGPARLPSRSPRSRTRRIRAGTSAASPPGTAPPDPIRPEPPPGQSCPGARPDPVLRIRHRTGLPCGSAPRKSFEIAAQSATSGSPVHPSCLDGSPRGRLPTPQGPVMARAMAGPRPFRSASEWR